MSYEPHYIASFENESGLDKYYEPFLIPEKAFHSLEDAFVWRGRVRKREGFSTLGRLRRSLVDEAMGNISAVGAGIFTFNIFTGLALSATEPNAQIEPGNITNIEIDIAAPISQTLTDTTGDGVLVIAGAGPITNAQIIYATGDLILTFSGAVAASAATITAAYYPSLPVMGLPTSITNAINEGELRAFDTKYSYKYTGTQFEELSPGTTWNGNDSDFFWTTTYWPPNANSEKFLWATNFNNSATPDPLRYYNPTLGVWVDFTPSIDGVHNLQTCRCIVPYKNRLLAFNTWEETVTVVQNFPQRLRFSERLVDPTAVDSWRSDIPGRGGFIDAPTDEQIISVEFIKDVLIVKFERSSWKIVYTGNEILPFVFEKINTEFGAESTFSLVPFDRGVFSVGNVGICTDDSINVYRIDQRIPDIVFEIRNADNGPKRVHGIRDFTNQVVYWAYPNSEEDLIYPNKVLVYNYINQTFSIFNDSFTCYGYFQKSTSNVWSSYTETEWQTANFNWFDGSQQSRYPDVVGGNQQGFVLLLNQDTFNSQSLTINNIIPAAPPNPVTITSVNHNFTSGQFIKITGIIGNGPNDPSDLNDAIYRIQVVDSDSFTLQLYDAVIGNFDNVTLDVGGTYVGGGVIAPINNILILTKVFAPFYEDGGQARIGYVDFLFGQTESGQLSCSVFINEDDITSVSETNPNTGLLGTNTVLTSPENPVLIPQQDLQSKIWHRFFIQSIAENFQFQLTMSDAQMSDEDITSEDIVLHAMVLYLSKHARLTQ